MGREKEDGRTEDEVAGEDEREAVLRATAVKVRPQLAVAPAAEAGVTIEGTTAAEPGRDATQRLGPIEQFCAELAAAGSCDGIDETIDVCLHQQNPYSPSLSPLPTSLFTLSCLSGPVAAKLQRQGSRATKSGHQPLQPDASTGQLLGR